MKFEIYQGGDQSWYWRLRGRNGRIVADGAEGYDSSGNVRRAIKRLQAAVGGATVVVLV